MSAKQQEARGIDRRSFLKLYGILGIGVAAGGLVPISESVAFNKQLYKVTKTRLGMGTYVSITVMHPSRVQGEEVIGMAFETMDRLTSLLDRYRSDSPREAADRGLSGQPGRLVRDVRAEAGPGSLFEDLPILGNLEQKVVAEIGIEVRGLAKDLAVGALQQG